MSERTGSRLTRPAHSNIRSHCENTSLVCGPVKQDNFRILGYQTNQTKLRILESLFIHCRKPNLNDLASSYDLKFVH